jgi:DNA-binding GntR family transcriptional regulator
VPKRTAGSRSLSNSVTPGAETRKGAAHKDRPAVPPVALDKRSPEPLYLQIKLWMIKEMDAGQWPVHYKLPAEEDLARSLLVSRGTVRQAIQELIVENRLTQIHGRGTFVISGRQIESAITEHLIAFSEDLILKNIPFETEVLEQRLIVPDTRVRALLGLKPDDLVFFLQRRRYVNNVPIIFTKNYVRYELCAGIEREEFKELQLFRCLETKFGLHLSWARRTSEARLASAQESAILDIPLGAPVLYMEQIVYLEDGRAAECSDIWMRGDRFRLSSIITRSGIHTPSNLT